MAKPLFRFNTRELANGIQKHLLEESQKAERAMRQVGHHLRGEVQLCTPVDEGFLTGSITFDVVQYRKSFATVIYVPSNSPASKYAVAMHENTYNLGPDSLAKMAKTGKDVGPGYIIRPIDNNRSDIRDIIISVMRV